MGITARAFLTVLLHTEKISCDFYGLNEVIIQLDWGEKTK